MKTILERYYSGDSLCDIDRDIYEAFYDIDMPVDDHGLQKGEFRVLITWEPEE